MHLILFILFFILFVGLFLLLSVFGFLRSLFGIGTRKFKSQDEGSIHQQQPVSKGKIFDKDDGEYVDFEEVD